MQEHIVNHFKKLCSQRWDFRLEMRATAWESDFDSHMLEEDFNKEEIKHIILELNNDKSPCPNGFPILP